MNLKFRAKGEKHLLFWKIYVIFLQSHYPHWIVNISTFSSNNIILSYFAEKKYVSSKQWLASSAKLFLVPHYVKNVHIRSFFWSVFSCIWTEYRKYKSEISPYLDTFHAVSFLVLVISKKFIRGRDNNKVDSVETERTNIAHFFPWSHKKNIPTPPFFNYWW